MTNPDPAFMAAVATVLKAPGHRAIVELTDHQAGLLDDQAAALGLTPGEYARNIIVELLRRVDVDALSATEQLPKPTAH